MTKIRDWGQYIGKKFRSLIVLEVIKSIPNGKFKATGFKCKCDCGNEAVVIASMVVIGRIRSCGCMLNKRSPFRKAKHGYAHTLIYKLFGGMKLRCYGKHRESYKHYGGRGIIICEEWLNCFVSFYNWAVENGWQKGLEIDRINNDGNYEPSNCRFVTTKENSNNRRTTRVLNLNGVKLSLVDWSNKLGIHPDTLRGRLRRGWDIKKTLTIPTNKNYARIK